MLGFFYLKPALRFRYLDEAMNIGDVRLNMLYRPERAQDR